MTWQQTPIKKVANVESGYGFPRQYQGVAGAEYPFYKVGDMNIGDNESEMRVSSNTISEEMLKELKARAFPAGTVIFPKIGAAIATNKKRILTKPSVVDNNIMGLIPKEGIDPWFLFYWMQQFDLRLVTNSGPVPSMRKSEVQDIKIPLPVLSEQRRIVEILSQADTLRKQTNEADAKTARIIPALYYQMFGDPVMNSMNWKMSSLSRLGAKVRYGLGQPPALLAGGLPMLRATNISRGIISKTDMIFVNPHTLPKGREVFLEAEEVLVVRSGAYTGDVAQVTEEWAGSVAGYDLIVNPGERMIGEFLEAYLLTSFIQDGYFSKHKSRAGQPHLNANQLLATPTPDIPKNLQEKFSLYVNTVREIRKCTIRRIPAINRLYKVLLSQAFSGKLTTNWRQAHMNDLLQEMEHQVKMLS